MARRSESKSKNRGKPDRSGRQFAALPFLLKEGETMVMLVTSRETHRWVLPKGWAEKRLSGPELAAKEALEEAGLIGEVAPDPIGSYGYAKRLPGGRVTPCDVQVFPLRVVRVLDDWPERRQRERRWFTLAGAAMAVEEGGLVALLLRLAAPGA
ncbi:MAG: NUDIX hydrolase [Acetobacteraceae bacterium]|nr:NUDIX hydrolase [Acetobacteraceae bacterium]